MCTKVHNVYKSDEYINERERIIFTRFKLSSHNLNIEKGKMSRIDRENRLYDCGLVQDEPHVLLYCPKTDGVRQRFNVYLEQYPNI